MIGQITEKVALSGYVHNSSKYVDRLTGMDPNAPTIIGTTATFLEFHMQATSIFKSTYVLCVLLSTFV